MTAAFASTITEAGVMGDKRYAYGTYTPSGGSTGGDITTGLSSVHFIVLQPSGSAARISQPAVTETLPKSSDGITVVTTADEAGYWYAVGF